MPESQKRQTAFIVRISDILEGVYVKEEGWQPNYIRIGNKEVSRVNIVAVVISMPEEEPFRTITVDDGARISVRSFEENYAFNGLEIGDTVLIIGRPREYSQQKYIMPEIIRKVDEHWIELRKLQLEKMEFEERFSESEEIKEEKKVVDEVSVEEVVVNPGMKRVFDLVKELDTGDGADFEAVMSQAEVENPEKIIRSLLEKGDLFELRPGKLKILE